MKPKLTSVVERTAALPKVDIAPPSGERERPYLEIVVPAYNEEGRLGSSLAHVAAYLARQPYPGAITVVDNGSFDRTADLVVDDHERHVPVRLIGCAKPGKGAAVRRGMLTSDATYVGFSDADLATPIETLDTMLPELEAGHPVVIASRRCPGAEYAVRQPLARRIASRGFRAVALAGMAELAEVHDTQCGFKFFSNEAAQRLFGASEASGFAFDVEILGLAILAGYSIREMPTVWEHVEGSKLTIAKDASRVFKELMAMRRNLRKVARSGAVTAPMSAPEAAAAATITELDVDPVVLSEAPYRIPAIPAVA